MKKDMIHILSPRQAANIGTRADDGQEQVFIYFSNAWQCKRGLQLNVKMYIEGLDGFKVYNHYCLCETFFLKVSSYWFCFV